MILRRLIPVLFILSLPLAGWAQGIQYFGISHSVISTQSVKKKNNYTPDNARKQPKEYTLHLPFWDDFSKKKDNIADSSIWYWGQSVTISDGMAINPPSFNVATFDGIDSVGNPYSVNDILAKGYADKLVSQNIDLSSLAEEDGVYLSFQYEMKGNGEMPDDGDRLQVLFLDDAGSWEPILNIENDGTFGPDTFHTAFVQVVDERFFHDKFKFRIQNFARLSGPYDTWHVDYVYMNKGRTPTDNVFPDRTIVTPLTNLFGKYRAVPIEHFKNDQSILTLPSVQGTNLKNEAQPFDYSVEVHMWKVEEGDTSDISTVLDANDSINAALEPHEFLTIPVQHPPSFAGIPDSTDAVVLDYKFWINSDDNNPNFAEFPGDKDIGDYDPTIYAPIDFRWNDTIRSTFLLANKYAYDDGVAEYGAGLNQPGAQLAYQYDLVGTETAFITHFELYFPRFGDESSQVLELRIWDKIDDDPVYIETTTLQRSENNVFWLKKLTRTVQVQDTFYIGWRQTAAANIAIGLDKNNDTGEKMFYNTNGDWVQNTLIQGSLMMRPVLGAGVFVGLEDEPLQLTVYPNPSSGTFYFNGVAEMISVYDMTGRSIQVTAETSTTETRLQLHSPSQGIYIIKAHVDGRVRTAKVMVR